MLQSIVSFELKISRRDFARTLKSLAGSMPDATVEASLSLEDGHLLIETSNASASITAKGTWPQPVFVQQTCILRLARRLPPGDPIQLRVDAGRLYVNRYSEPCTSTKLIPPVSTETNPSILKAARILELLRIKRSDLEELVLKTRVRGTSSWSAEDKKMAAIVAKAWQLLAPFGVETSDIRQLVQKAIRNAWK